MRLPKEAHQVQQVIETYLPHLCQAQLAGLVPVGMRRYSGGKRLPERRRVSPLALGKLEQPTSVSEGMVVRRQRPSASLHDRARRRSLLSWVLAW